MKKFIMSVGLDVQKDSTEVAFADTGRDGEVRSYGKIDGNLTALDMAIRELEAQGSELHFAYVAGPCGCEIYRHLSSYGYDCIVVAPSMIPRLRRQGDARTDPGQRRRQVGGVERRSNASWLFFFVMGVATVGRRPGVRAISAGLPSLKCHTLLNRSSCRSPSMPCLNAQNGLIV